MADEEENDPTASFNELESFDSICQALKWKQIQKRIPICFKKTVHNRYFFANLVYFLYTIGILIIEFNPWINGEAEVVEEIICSCNETLFEEITETETGLSVANQMYLALTIVYLVSATLYWWAWKDHRWNDVIMIPEYLNHIEGALYLWSAIWYAKEDGNYGYYTLTIHKLETLAAIVDLFASFGWIMSWYRTYARTIGRGFTLDDADTVANTLTTLAAFIYTTYNIQILMHPEQYGENILYCYGDIIYFISAFFYLWANLRDDGWLWWMPVAGQYGIAPGRIQTGKSVKAGLPHLLMGGNEPFTRCGRRCLKNKSDGRGRRIEPIDEKQAENRV